MKRIPIRAGRHIADEYNYDQVVIIARKCGDGGGEHVTTYGVNKDHCAVAARIGDFIKNKIMKWPPSYPHTAPTPAQQLAECEEALDAAIQRAEAAEASLATLQDRLEMRHAWQSKAGGPPERTQVEPGSIPDGISCRDETIKLQDERIAKLAASLATVERDRSQEVEALQREFSERLSHMMSRAEAAEASLAASEARADLCAAGVEEAQAAIFEARSRAEAAEASLASARREALEEAAKIGDGRAAHWGTRINQSMPDVSAHDVGRRAEATVISERIRSLASPRQEDTQR